MSTASLSARFKSRDRHASRTRRHRRVRKRALGTSVRPRLAVFRSSRHIYAQVINDISNTTIAAASTLDGSFKGKKLNKSDAAKQVGALIAERAKAVGVSEVLFDRGGFAYHGRVAALADGARDGGLEF